MKIAFKKNTFLQKLKEPRHGAKWEIIPEEYKKIFSNENSDKVRVELLDAILSNRELYNYCLEMFGKYNSDLSFIRHFKNIDETLSFYTFSKKSVIESLKENINSYKHNLIKYKRYKNIIKTSEYNFYEKNIKNSSINIGDKTIVVKDIINILSIPINSKKFISDLNLLGINIDELMNCLNKKPINLLSKYSILDGYNFPLDIKEKVLKNIDYLNKNAYLFNRINNSDIYVLDIINFFINNNVDEYIKNSDNILGFSFSEIANILNEFIFKVNYSDDNAIWLINYNKEFVNALDPKLKDKLSNFIDIFIPDPLSENEFSSKNNFINVEINEDLQNKIFSELPDNYTDLQKCYYIYKYLCANFVYDPYYLAGSQKEEYDINNHKNINNIKNINLKNNKVVCYDISLILAKLIEKLGYPIQLIDSNEETLKNYGSSHAAVKTKIGDYLINIDIAFGLIHNDMTHQQLTGDVEHFKILNKTKRVRETAKKELEEVDEYFNSIYDSYKKHLDALKEYQENYEQNLVTFDDKINIIISSLLNNNIDDTSKILNTNKIIKTLFGKSNDNCFITFLGSKVNTKSENTVALGCILVCNEDSIEGNNGKNKFFLFPNLSEYYSMTKQEIETLIRDKKIIGIAELGNDLIGIDEKLFIEGDANINEKESFRRNK